ERIRALDMAGIDVLDHLHHHARRKGGVIDFAHALDAVIGDELEENEIAPAGHGRRIADHESLETGYFQGRCSPARQIAEEHYQGPRRTASAAICKSKSSPTLVHWRCPPIWAYCCSRAPRGAQRARL